ncbi:hypothetical protein GCM10017556_27140 [Micromonospora sagamiensis]|nr:hypothetical protein GCM10017556_27140 [Micromonospora sagamiensis]
MGRLRASAGGVFKKRSFPDKIKKRDIDRSALSNKPVQKTGVSDKSIPGLSDTANGTAVKLHRPLRTDLPHQERVHPAFGRAAPGAFNARGLAHLFQDPTDPVLGIDRTATVSCS